MSIFFFYTSLAYPPGCKTRHLKAFRPTPNCPKEYIITLFVEDLKAGHFIGKGQREGKMYTHTHTYIYIYLYIYIYIYIYIERERERERDRGREKGREIERERERER